MRNQRGDPLKNNLKRKDTELFTVERIPAGTRFVAEIHCEDETLRKKLWPLLRRDQRFHLGRGKAPVTIIKVGDAPSRQSSEIQGSLTLIALSDWLILGDNLGYLDELNVATLLRCAFGIENSDTEYPNLILESCQETEIHGSYNYATGLPRLPQAVIRRGSVFRLSGEQEELNTLRQHLQGQGPVGERTTEGYGQFLVEPPLPDFLREEQEPVSDSVASPPQEAEPPPEAEETPEHQEADQPPESQPTTVGGEQTPESTDTPSPAETPNEEDESCAIKAREQANTYFEQWPENVRNATPPDFAEWQTLKQDLIGEETPMLATKGQSNNIQNYFHTSLRRKSLFQYITQLRPPQGCDLATYKTHFLNALEGHLYGGEQS